MPELIVYLLEGRSVEDKRALVKDLTGAVVKNLGVPQNRLRSRWSKPRAPTRARAGSCSPI